MQQTTTAERAEEAAKRLYFSYLEPIHFATRKHRRLEIFRIGSVEELGASSVDLQAGADGCVPVCAEMVEGHQRYLAKYLFASGGAAPSSWRWRGVPLVIDLDRYPDFDHYAAQLKLQSKGAGTRQIRKARRLGLYCRPYDRAQRGHERFEIETSLRFRAGGPVVAAYLRRRPEGVAQPIVERDPPMPACLRHWSTDWGVFAPPDDGSMDGCGEHLIGFICLKRVGNIVQVAALMGHGAHLAGGTVKLLFADVMKWMLDRRDPRVRDIRYLHYGAIEQGSDGLAIWKHRFQFQPCIFRWPAPAPPEPPAALSQVARPVSTPPRSGPAVEPGDAGRMAPADACRNRRRAVRGRRPGETIDPWVRHLRAVLAARCGEVPGSDLAQPRPPTGRSDAPRDRCCDDRSRDGGARRLSGAARSAPPGLQRSHLRSSVCGVRCGCPGQPAAAGRDPRLVKRSPAVYGPVGHGAANDRLGVGDRASVATAQIS
jgi:hypothetical protein